MEMLYSLKNIEFCLGERFRLEVQQLELQPGRIHVFTGPNGAGKSTLLRLLSFLVKPDQGEILFQERKVSHDSAALTKLRRRVTMVDQSPYLFSGSVSHNLTFGLRLRGVHGRELKKQVGEALDTVGLHGFEHCRVEELSGGEAQRVALARALVLSPKVLVLDEPTANVDRISLAKIEAVLLKLPEEGVTVIMSTHDEAQLQRIGGQAISIERGRLYSESPAVISQTREKTAKEKSEWPHHLKMLGN